MFSRASPDSATLSRDYMDELTCDTHMLKYQPCLSSWKAYWNPKSCESHISDYQLCMVSLNTELDDFRAKQQRLRDEKGLSDKVGPSVRL